MNALLKTTTALCSLLMTTSVASAVSQQQLNELLNIIRDGDQKVHIDGSIDKTHTGSIATFSDKKRHLPFASDEPFLRGENDVIKTQIYLSAEHALQGVEIELAFNNSATVLPGESTLKLHVNDRLVKTVGLRNAEQVGRMIAKLDASSLKPGKNEITISAEHYHRVDCSLAATYELWSQIIPSKSFINFNGVSNSGQHITRLEEIRELVRNDNQKEKLYIVRSNDAQFETSNELLETYSALVQKVSRVGKLLNPEVEFLSSDNQQGAGLDIFVGSLSEFTRNDYLKNAYGKINPQGFVQNPESGDLVMSSINGERVLVANVSELSQRMSSKSLAGLQTVSDEAEARTVTFEELGYKAIEYTGKRFSRKLELDLPAAFYPSDYNTIKFHLYGSYAQGLKADQRLLLNVNGETTTSIPFSKSKGDVFYGHVLEIPLSAFKPGTNSIELVALLEREDEQACSLTGSRQRDTALFISGQSYFEVPKLAKAGHFPDVRNTLLTGFPYRAADERGPLHLELMGNREQSFPVAASFLAQIAARADVNIPVVIDGLKHAAQGTQDINKLIVAPLSNVPQSFVGLRPEVAWSNIESNWQGENLAEIEIDTIKTSSVRNVSVLRNAGPDVSHLQSGSQLTPQAIPQEKRSSLQNQFIEHAQRERDSSLSFNIGGQLAGLLSPLEDQYSKMSGSEKSASQIDSGSSVVVSQAVKDGALITLLGYPEGTTSLPTNMENLISKASYNDRFHTVGLGGANAFSGMQETSSVLLMDQSWSFSNTRLVFAGWLSNQPLLFGILFSLILVAWSVFTNALLKRTERSAGEEFETDV